MGADADVPTATATAIAAHALRAVCCEEMVMATLRCGDYIAVQPRGGPAATPPPAAIMNCRVVQNEKRMDSCPARANCRLCPWIVPSALSPKFGL